jgi:hypothetical protein
MRLSWRTWDGWLDSGSGGIIPRRSDEAFGVEWVRRLFGLYLGHVGECLECLAMMG